MLLMEPQVVRVPNWSVTPQPDQRTQYDEVTMRKHFLIAGMLLAAALAFAGPSKADTVQVSLSGINASFTLQDTFTPDFSFQGVQYVFDVQHGTLLSGTDVTYGT